MTSAIPDGYDPEKFVRVLQLVTTAMNNQDRATYSGDGFTGMHDISVQITKRILDLFE